MAIFVSLKIEQIGIPQRLLLQISMPGQSSSSLQPSTEKHKLDYKLDSNFDSLQNSLTHFHRFDE